MSISPNIGITSLVTNAQQVALDSYCVAAGAKGVMCLNIEMKYFTIGLIFALAFVVGCSSSQSKPVQGEKVNRAKIEKIIDCTSIEVCPEMEEWNRQLEEVMANESNK